MAVPPDDPAPDPPVDDGDQVPALAEYLRSIGRDIRLEGDLYVDPRCPVGNRHPVTVGNLDTDAVILACQVPCDRVALVEAYGLHGIAAQLRDQAEARDTERRFRELRADHLARQRFARWLQEQEARR